VRWSLVFLTGCVLGGDAGLLTRDPSDPRGASGTVHMALGGGGMEASRYILSLGFDSRIDLASGGSRWTGGGSVLGGIRTGPLYIDARAGVWRAIVSSVPEGSIAPTLELGGYVPTGEKFDPKHPQFGSSDEGVVFGIREDFDLVNYFTVFVGYALFISPGY
jgi:hypothetical protein